MAPSTQRRKGSGIWRHKMDLKLCVSSRSGKLARSATQRVFFFFFPLIRTDSVFVQWVPSQCSWFILIWRGPCYSELNYHKVQRTRILRHPLGLIQHTQLIALGMSSVMSFETMTRSNKFSKAAAKHPLSNAVSF